MSKRISTISLMLLLLCVTTSAKADELHMVFLPIVIDTTPNMGAHVWSTRHVPVLAPGSIAYVPVYPDNAMYTYHDNVMPLLMGRPVVLGFRNWTGEPECLPPPPDEYDDWAAWVATTTQDYIADGHTIIAVEVWNEPEPADGGHYWGCWGNTEEAGAQYAELVREVYQRIGGQVDVIGGALMFYTLPEPPPFWIGAIGGGVDDYLDGVSYHNYSGWPTNNWETVFDKADILRQYTDKPLWVTETSLMCDNDCGEQFEHDQAAYLDYVMNGASAHGIEAVMWFMAGYNNWRNTDLVREDYSFKPVFYEYEKYFSMRK